MRPSAYLCLFMVVTVAGAGMLSRGLRHKRSAYDLSTSEARKAVEVFGLSDLAVTTEARYTRHPAVSDRLVPFMDHPGGLEHFPSGSFYRPVP